MSKSPQLMNLPMAKFRSHLPKQISKLRIFHPIGVRHLQQSLNRNTSVFHRSILHSSHQIHAKPKPKQKNPKCPEKQTQTSHQCHTPQTNKHRFPFSSNLLKPMSNPQRVESPPLLLYPLAVTSATHGCHARCVPGISAARAGDTCIVA